MQPIFLRAYATIPTFFNEVFGLNIPDIPINTYGTFVALGFLTAAILAAKNLKYRGEQGIFKGYLEKRWEGKPPQILDILSPFLLWFIIGYKFVGAIFSEGSLLTQGQKTVGYLLSLEGFWLPGILMGIAAAAIQYFLIKRNQKETPLEVEYEVKPQDMVGELVGVAAVFGVFGASIFELIQPGSDMTLKELFSDPMNFLSGLTIYGGLFFGIIGIFLYSKYRNLKLFHLFDSISAPYLLAYGIGRLGCHFSGDGDWGKINLSESPSWLPDYFWANNYAHSVIGGANVEPNTWETIAGCTGQYCLALASPVWPTSIYEFTMCVVLFAVMWAMRKKTMLAPGLMFCILFVFNGIERYFIETMRVTRKFENFFNLTQAQIISIVMIVLGVGGIIYLYKRYKEEIKSSSF